MGPGAAGHGSMPPTLTRGGDIDRVFGGGTRHRTGVVLAVILRRDEGSLRVAYLTAKGIGCAARRNRQRRRLREAFRSLRGHLADQPVDMLLMALPPAVNADFETLRATLARILDREGLLEGACSARVPAT